VPVTFGRRKSMLRSELRLVESFRRFASDANGTITRTLREDGSCWPYAYDGLQPWRGRVGTLCWRCLNGRGLGMGRALVRGRNTRMRQWLRRATGSDGLSERPSSPLAGASDDQTQGGEK